MNLARLKAIVIVIGGVLCMASYADAADLKVLTTGILKGSFNDIAVRFERETGHTLTMSWGPSSGKSPEASQVRIRNGERVDVLIMVDNGMDEVIKGGYFKPLERKDIAVSKIGVAVKKGQPWPEIGTVTALRKALLDARSIGYSEGASGTYIASVLLKKLGIADEVAPKSKVILGRRFVGEALTDGEIELGLQQISELRLEPGVDVIGPLPEELQKRSVVSAAVSSNSANVTAAKQFIDFLSSPGSKEAMIRSGLDLPAPRP
ncbi:molybdate ABC transporter substrate-binding protein [Methylobacterium sp. WSM2598]|uniref:molybdate ABC transporter substrate-binding protein n=1 Tax=Methylobacterium sp. WSM2598 TaxID=398261 RepID=UPI00035F4EA8|nr:substrate-binding domain-containing protein [Methylobacterium sp. WSM2598]